MKYIVIILTTEGKMEKTGKIKVLSVKAGIILDGEDSWINYDDNDASLKEKALKEFSKGDYVKLTLSSEQCYTNIEHADEPKETTEEIQMGDVVVDEEIEQIINKPTTPQELEREFQKSTGGKSPLEGLFDNPNPNGFIDAMMGSFNKLSDPEYFNKLKEVKVETATKGPMNLKYASWAEVWGKLKESYPKANYHVHENKEGMPYFKAAEGAFVKVSVTVQMITHTIHLPVMNFSNKAAKGPELDVVLINKNIMRAFAKCIAMHGIGLKVFQGEDYPEEPK